jgi:MscS family membrane protein
MMPMRSLLVLALTLLPFAAPPATGQGATAQAEPAATGQEAVDPRFDSPRSTMFTFLAAVNDAKDGDRHALATAVACLDLGDVEVTTSQQEQQLASALWTSLNRIRLVEESELPDAAAVGAQTSFLYFPRPFTGDDELLARIPYGGQRIELAAGSDGRWRFSASTVSGILELARALSGLEKRVDVDESALDVQPLMRRWMPPSLKEDTFLGVENWQWLGLLALVFLGLLADFLVRVLTRPIVRRVVARYQEQASDDAVDGLVRPLGLLAEGIVWLALIHMLGFGGAALAVLLAAVHAFTILAGTWAGWSLADLVGEVLTRRAAATESTIDDVLVPLLRKTFKVFLLAFGLIYAAQSLHFNIVPLITGLGIGGLAFAFAAKDTIENLFGSVAVILDRPFEIGDWVVVEGVEGTVEAMGFRSTRIRTFYNSQVTVPNATLVRATVDNYGRRKYRRWKTTVGVQYDTSPDQLIAFTEGIRELIRTHPYTRKDYFQIWCNDFADSSLNVMVYMFFEVPDWSTELRERERLFIDIVRLADRLGVSFAFPTSTVHLYREEHGPSDAVHEPPGATSDRRATITGVRAAQALVANQPWRERPPGPVEFAGGPTHLEIADPLEATEDTRQRKGD